MAPGSPRLKPNPKLNRKPRRLQSLRLRNQLNQPDRLALQDRHQPTVAAKKKRKTKTRKPAMMGFILLPSFAALRRSTTSISPPLPAKAPESAAESRNATSSATSSKPAPLLS